ncbi:hypothetical protein [Marisediminicola sp. LYQ134]
MLTPLARIKNWLRRHWLAEFPHEPEANLSAFQLTQLRKGHRS